MAIKSGLLEARVMHQRLTPLKNGFTYKQYYLFLRADELWDSKLRLFSINKFNIFSLYFKKYGKRNFENPYLYARELLEEHCKKIDWLKDIFVLTQPSLLGWSFNPVSFWLYVDHQDKLRAVLSEVNNTFGEHHKYFSYHPDFSVLDPKDPLEAKKVFYVSPFYEVKGKYTFRFNLKPDKIGVWINYFIDGEKTLLTSLTGHKKPLSDIGLMKMFFKIPLGNLKTVFLIHFQALKIWLKGVGYVPRKDHKLNEVSTCYSSKKTPRA